MSALPQRAGAAAVDRVLDRMAALVVADATDVVAERLDGALRLSGPRLAIRVVEDVRLRALAAQAVRARP